MLRSIVDALAALAFSLLLLLCTVGHFPSSTLGMMERFVGQRWQCSPHPTRAFSPLEHAPAPFGGPHNTLEHIDICLFALAVAIRCKSKLIFFIAWDNEVF